MSFYQHYIALGIFLFSIGLVVIMMKKNFIMMLIGIELLLNGCNLNLVGFNLLYPGKLDGQMFSLFVIIVAVTETAVGLAIILRVYKEYGTSVPEEVSQLKD